MNSGYARWRFVLIVLLTTTVGLYLSGWLFGALKAVGDILTLYFTAWLLQFLRHGCYNSCSRLSLTPWRGVASHASLVFRSFM